MSFQTFYDQTDEHGVSNRDKLAQHQHIIRRVDTTAKDRSFEAAEGHHDGVVVVDGKLIGFGIHIFNEDIGTEGAIVIVICFGFRAFKRNEQGAFPAKILFLRLRAFAHTSARIDGIGKVQNQNRFCAFSIQIIRELLRAFPCQRKGIDIFAAVSRVFWPCC